MVTITNGVNTFSVTQGAYNSVWRALGFRIVGGKSKGAGNTAPSARKAENEKPLAQWSNDEIKAYAEAHGIDLHGTKNANQARERIRAYKASENAQEA